MASISGGWGSRIAITIALLAAVIACVARAGDVPPPPDHVVPAWYQGIPVVMRSFEISPQPIMVEADIPNDVPYPQVVSYIVGVVDDAIGVSPARTLGGPGSARSVMPGHQAVIACLHTPDSPGLGVAYSVVPGPAADEHTVRADTVQQSVIGAPLATHIKIGPSWVPLTSHVAIEYGLRKGLLRLRFFGANPVGWATPDWDRNYAYMPEMAGRCEQPPRADRTFVSERTVAASAKKQAPQTAVETCNACHGPSRRPETKAPMLDGQKAAYLRKQLHAFRNGERSDPQMTAVAKSLRDEEIARLTGHFSALPLQMQDGGPTLDPTEMPLVFCVRCHGARGVSPNDVWPNLAGQDLAYLRKQIDAFSRGTRHDDMMSSWGRMVGDEDMLRILDFYSKQTSAPTR